MHTKLQLLGISDSAASHSLWHFLTHAIVIPSFLGLAPQVRAPVHAGNVEHSDTLQRRAAEIQNDAITLGKKQRNKKCERVSLMFTYFFFFLTL